MSNSCVPDIFSCTGQGSDGLQDKGYLYPISHVFSRQEVEDLDNPTQMPEQYYSYIKKEGTKKRRALSLTDPTSFTDYDSGGTTPIKSNNNSVLDRIKTYRIKANPDTDMKAFIVVDPKFYNLREYIDSGNAFYGNRAGTYNTGYNQFDSEGKRVLTYKTCPILGLTGYSGICDPDQKAGCNVPIYGVGSQTYFDHIDENLTLTYTDYPVIWSGYVKEWAWISRQQYFENIEGRIGKFGGRLYLDNEDEDEPNVKEGPIFMVTRSDDYCSERETYTGRLYDPESKRLPCIQYYQYQETAGEGDSKEYRFLNLFSPEPDLRANPDYAFSSLISYNIVNGMAKYDEPVAGADFLSRETPNYIERIEDDEVSRPARGQQIYDTDESRINATDGNQTIGNYRGDDSSSGAGIGIRQGVRDGLRLKVPAGADTTGISSRCAIVDNRRTDPNNENVFIPTNSHSELQSFLSAAEANQVDEMSARNCIPSYETFDHYQRTVKGVASPPPNPNGSLTWIGNLRCSDLKLDKKPACNQTVLLTAQRTCLLEDGLAGDCTDCLNARVFDPDANVILDDETVGGEVLSGPDYPGRPNMCYFSALCYNLSSKGCPGAGTSGGHVFCLSADTKITMADGTKKEIINIKAGERVMAFSGKRSKQKQLQTAQVKATAITYDQTVMKITISGFYDAKGAKRTKVLKITPRHKMVRANGRAVIASELYPGDKIIKANGRLGIVDKIETEGPKINVYNLVLEDGFDGYIANSMRVLSYPILRGMRLHSKTIQDEDN